MDEALTQTVVAIREMSVMERAEYKYELAIQKMREVQELVGPTCYVDWGLPPHRPGHWARFSLALTFPSGFKVTIAYWWRGSYWSR